MRHARRAPAPPGDVPAHRASPQFKPRAGVLTRGRTRGHDGRSHRGARSFVRFLRGGAPPARSAPARSAFHLFRASFSSHHSPLVHRRRPRTAKETRRRRWNPSRSSPMRRRSPSRSSTPRYWRRRRSSGNRGRRRRMPTSRRCAPRRLAFSPHPASRRSRPRRGGRCPPSFGAHDTTRDVRDVPGASRAHLDVRA